MSERILAVGHDAYRAGSQIVFLHVLRWLRAHDADVSLLLTAAGALLDDYAAVLPTTVLPVQDDASSAATGRAAVPARVRRRLGRRPEPVTPIGSEPGTVDVVYANSIATAHVAAAVADQLRCPAVLHVHELEMSILRFGRPNRLRNAMRRIDRFIAVSRAVEENLVARHGIPADRIDRIPPCIPIPAAAPDAGRSAALRAELGIPGDAFVVGGCGTADWRKGPDLFLLVAKALGHEAAGRPVHFLWVGGEPRELRMVEHDLARLGLGATVHFVGIQPDPAPYFGVFDAFLLSSREDPYPLVCLEAAAIGVPIVCFADAGGMPEFVEDDAGFVVPYLDLAAAAERLATLAGSEDARTRLGRQAAVKAAERCDIAVVGPQIAAVLGRYRR